MVDEESKGVPRKQTKMPGRVPQTAKGRCDAFNSTHGSANLGNDKEGGQAKRKPGATEKKRIGENKKSRSKNSSTEACRVVRRDPGPNRFGRGEGVRCRGLILRNVPKS